MRRFKSFTIYVLSVKQNILDSLASFLKFVHCLSDSALKCQYKVLHFSPFCFFYPSIMLVYFSKICSVRTPLIQRVVMVTVREWTISPLPVDATTTSFPYPASTIAYCSFPLLNYRFELQFRSNLNPVKALQFPVSSSLWTYCRRLMDSHE